MSLTKEDKIIYKRLIGLLKPYIKKISVIFICILASSAISMTFPLFSKKVMDDGLLAKDFGLVVKFSILTLALVLFDQLIGLIETKYFSYVNSTMQYSLLKTAFKHLFKLRLQYFTNTNYSEIMGNIGMDVSNISRICDKGTFIIISQVFRIIGGLIGLLLIDWRLTVLVIVIIPLRYFIVKFLAKKRKEMFNEYMEYNRDFYSWYGDTINGIKEIKLWGIGRVKIGEFIKKQRKIVKLNIRMAFLDKMNEYSETLVYQGINTALYILGAYIVFKNGVSIGGLFAFITYSGYVIGPISSILNIGYNFSNIMPSAKRYFDFLDTETEAESNLKGLAEVSESGMKEGFRFENVCFSYKADNEILKSVNFEIKSGEKVAVIGTNGSGKSTLINLLLRFYKPQQGKILLDGTDINELKLYDYRKMISVVSQDLYLFNTTIEENIKLYAKADESKLNKVTKDSRAYEFIQEMPLKYQTQVGRDGSKLSGGQRQKIAMARAFARDSRILILDEATSSFDMESEVYINEMLEKEFGDKTVVVVSHRPDILKRVDKILLLDNGSVTEFKNYLELKNSSYSKIFEEERRFA